MRISDEIDALEVWASLARVPVLDPPAGRVMVLPFMYIGAIGAGFFATICGGAADRGGVVRGFFLIFWMFQNPPDLSTA